MWLVSQNDKAQEESLSVAWFFFGAMVTNTIHCIFSDHMIPQIKSMAQHLHQTDKLSPLHKDLFPINYCHDLEYLVNIIAIDIAEKHIKRFSYARSLNMSLAFFLMDAYSLMDRGFISNLICSYIKKVRAHFIALWCYQACGFTWDHIIAYNVM